MPRRRDVVITEFVVEVHPGRIEWDKCAGPHLFHYVASMVMWCWQTILLLLLTFLHVRRQHNPATSAPAL